LTKIQCPQGRLLAALVRRYRKRRASVVDGELAWFREQPTFADALDRAAFGRTRGEKRHPHQYRIRREALPLAREALCLARGALAVAEDFDRLHELVEAAVGSIPGIGRVYAYDTAVRLGANLGLAHAKVYLHAGTAKGARVLGFKGNTVEVVNLPPELQELDALHLEDFLCVNKKILKRNAARAARRPHQRGPRAKTR
jgi:hypothetical protein